MPNPRYKKNMDTTWKMRITEEDKKLLNEAAVPPVDYPYSGSTTWWRDVDIMLADKLLKLKSGDLTISEFSASVEDFAEKYLKDTSEKSKDEK